jgi:malate synthase
VGIADNVEQSDAGWKKLYDSPEPHKVTLPGMCVVYLCVCQNVEQSDADWKKLYDFPEPHKVTLPGMCVVPVWVCQIAGTGVLMLCYNVLMLLKGSNLKMIVC